MSKVRSERQVMRGSSAACDGFRHTPEATTTPSPPEPMHEPVEPGMPEAPPPPEETPLTEPKQFPIHPEIPVQPIHEGETPRCIG